MTPSLKIDPQRSNPKTRCGTGIARPCEPGVGRLRPTPFLLLISRPCLFASSLAWNRCFLQLILRGPHGCTGLGVAGLGVGTFPTLRQPIGHGGDSGLTGAVPFSRFPSAQKVPLDTRKRKSCCCRCSGIDPPENYPASVSAFPCRPLPLRMP